MSQIPTTKLFGKPQCGTYRRGQSQGSRSHEGTLGFFGTGVWLGVIGPRFMGGDVPIGPDLFEGQWMYYFV